MSPRLRSRQRGAIGLMAAGTLAIAMVFMLLAVDSGRLYLEKRKLQSIADTPPVPPPVPPSPSPSPPPLLQPPSASATARASAVLAFQNTT